MRTTALDALVAAFLAAPRAAGARVQIVSLGAGSDTRFFRLRARGAAAGLVYHELDFAAVTGPKVAAIVRHALLAPGDVALADAAAGVLHAPAAGYYVHALDLRALAPGCALPPGVDAALPTLLLSECCLIYLAPGEADAIVRWAAGAFGAAVGMAVYEPIGGDDAFGRVMVQNLAARGIVLKTLKKYSSLERQRLRFKALGFTGGQAAADVYFISETWVSDAEKARIAALEMLDEVEEWRMLARHYCVAWAWRGPEFEAAWAGAFPVNTDE